jgi:hypothetical protein
LLVKQGAYPRRKHLKCAPIGLTLALFSKSKFCLERDSKDKCSILLGLVVSDKGKSFITLSPGEITADKHQKKVVVQVRVFSIDSAKEVTQLAFDKVPIF